MNLANMKKTIRLIDAQTAGVDGGAVLSAAIDCESANRGLLEFDVVLALENGVFAVSISECATSGGIYAAISGASVSATAPAATIAKQLFQIDFPISKRYIKVTYQRTLANITTGPAILSLYDLKMLPSAQDASVESRVIA